ncbi:ABC transporter ATP-binding protein [Caballeronia sp. DA-9]|uniref:ABC transporter ATP-binding protein n=1 Tax=Caballeronia sp. DA-9 TaxID=3436237 RepID=UPI003F67E129
MNGISTLSSASASAATRPAAHDDAPLLRVRNLKKHYAAGGMFGRRVRVSAVDGVSFDIAAGETLGLVGESGCGKSTVSRLLLRLLDPDEGRIEFRGADLARLKRNALLDFRSDLQMVFQDPFSSLNPVMTVRELVAEPLVVHHADLRTGIDRRVAELLEMVGLHAAHMHRYPHEFSGGQRQRIGIARALALEPKLIVCDEPVSALDVSVQAQVLNLLLALQRQTGVGMLFISHDLMAVRYIAHRIAVMYLGRLVETAPTRTIFSAPCHPYTRALLGAVPALEAGQRARVVLGADLPSPLDPPSGCHFHPRCVFAAERCRREAPELVADETGHACACHHWRDLPHWEGLSPSLTEPPPPRTARLIERFRQTPAPLPLPAPRARST